MGGLVCQLGLEMDQRRWLAAISIPKMISLHGWANRLFLCCFKIPFAAMVNVKTMRTWASVDLAGSCDSANANGCFCTVNPFVLTSRKDCGPRSKTATLQIQVPVAHIHKYQLTCELATFRIFSFELRM